MLYLRHVKTSVRCAPEKRDSDTKVSEQVHCKIFQKKIFLKKKTKKLNEKEADIIYRVTYIK